MMLPDSYKGLLNQHILCLHAGYSHVLPQSDNYLIALYLEFGALQKCSTNTQDNNSEIIKLNLLSIP